MKKNGKLLVYGFCATVFVYLWQTTKFSSFESFIIAFQLLTLLQLVYNFGKTICFFDLLTFSSCLDTLTMPLVAYNIYTVNHPLSQTWGFYMRVDEVEYYSYMVPANLCLFFGVGFFNSKIASLRVVDRIRAMYKSGTANAATGFVLIAVGFISEFIKELVPSGLQFVVFLLSMLKYVGPLYVYFSSYRYKNIILSISFLSFLLQAIRSSMFGEFVMYTGLIAIVVAVNYRLYFLQKLLSLVAVLFLVLLVQSVKPVYRDITWLGKRKEGMSISEKSEVDIFLNLAEKRISDPRLLFDEKALFFVYRRINQGYLISREMNYIPRVEPYANGETIVRSLAAVFVPRILWPEKPEAGGAYNLARFLGIKQKLTYSMNIGPYGEAHGNFGSVGGSIFIFIYGVFLAALFLFIVKQASRTPVLFLWFPYLFYYTLTMETDILTTVNSIVKSYIFVAILFWLFKDRLK